MPGLFVASKHCNPGWTLCHKQHIPLENPRFPSSQLSWLAPFSAQNPASQSQSRSHKHTLLAAVLWKKLTVPKFLRCCGFACIFFLFLRRWNVPQRVCLLAYVCVQERERMITTPRWTVDLTTKPSDCTKGCTRLLICHYGCCIFFFFPEKRFI